jgi:hypothetical protein
MVQLKNATVAKLYRQLVPHPRRSARSELQESLALERLVFIVEGEKDAVISKILSRRDLNPGQRAMIWQALAPMLEVGAKNGCWRARRTTLGRIRPRVKSPIANQLASPIGCFLQFAMPTCHI